MNHKLYTIYAPESRELESRKLDRPQISQPKNFYEVYEHLENKEKDL